MNEEIVTREAEVPADALSRETGENLTLPFQ